MASLTQTFKRGFRLAPRAARFALREPRSALLLARMAVWVALLSLLIKLLPLPSVLKALTPLSRRRAKRADTRATQARLARLLDLLLATDFWVFTPTCWKRAPVLYRFLALEGVRTRVVFGVRKQGAGALDGHAWLEYDKQPLLEKSPPDYAVTFSFPE